VEALSERKDREDSVKEGSSLEGETVVQNDDEAWGFSRQKNGVRTPVGLRITDDLIPASEVDSKWRNKNEKLFT
jgi:hypothetical protein